MLKPVQIFLVFFGGVAFQAGLFLETSVGSNISKIGIDFISTEFDRLLFSFKIDFARRAVGVFIKDFRGDFDRTTGGVLLIREDFKTADPLLVFLDGLNLFPFLISARKSLRASFTSFLVFLVTLLFRLSSLLDMIIERVKIQSSQQTYNRLEL
jgi:hypothetical protein